MRYRFLETLREFALARFAELPEAEQLRWRRAHLEVFYGLLLTVPRRYDSANVRCEEIRPYQDNFLPALEFCRQDQPERALVFCWHLSTFWDWFAQSTLAREQLKLTLALPECQELTEHRCIALDELYYACIYTRDWEGAEFAIDTSNLPTDIPHYHRLYSAGIKMDQGDIEAAQRLLISSLEIARQHGETSNVYDCLFRLHSASLIAGDISKAWDLLQEMELLDQCYSEMRGPQEALLRAKSLLKGLRGELHEAHELAVRACTPHLSHHEIGYSLILFAHLALLEGSFKQATQIYGASIAWCQQKGFDLRGYNYFSREQNLATLRSTLGDAEFQKHFDQGYDEDAIIVLQQMTI